MLAPTRRPLALSLTLALSFALAGCDQPTGTTRKIARKPKPAEPVAEAEAPAAPVGPRPILGQKTQDIRDMAKEQKAGGVVTPPRITAKDPIRLQGNAYVSIIGQTSILNIQHALDLYQAETGEFPKTTEDFMEKIIKANNIALPKLPFYQEYNYDAPNHKLVVMEYQDRKDAANYPK